MREYVQYLERVFEYVLQHPEELNKLSSPNPFLASRESLFSGEPVTYCYPTPSAYMKLVEMSKNE